MATSCDQSPAGDLTLNIQNLNLDPEQHQDGDRDRDRSPISILFQQKEESGYQKPPVFDLFSLFDNKVTTFNLPNSSSFIGFGHGRLILADDRCRLSLFDPSTNNSLKLPKIATLDAVTPILGFDDSGRAEKFNIRFPSLGSKFELTPRATLPMMIFRASVILDPSGGFMVFLFLKLPRPGLAFANPGDKKWTVMKNSLISESLDVTCHKGELFTVTKDGGVSSWDFGGFFPSMPKLTMLPALDREEAKELKGKSLEDYFLKDVAFFLASSPSGDLWRVRKDKVGSSWAIKVHKIEFDKKMDFLGGWKLVEVRSLGDNVIFIGGNTTVCVCSAEFPGLKGDHVYFADSGLHRDKLDVGIYSLKHGTTEMMTVDDVADIHTQPAWIVPGFASKGE